EGWNEAQEMVEVLGAQSTGLFRRDVGSVRTQRRSIGKKDAGAGVVHPSPPVLLPPGSQLIDDLGIAVTAARPRRCIHDDGSFFGALQSYVGVRSAQLFKF